MRGYFYFRQKVVRGGKYISSEPAIQRALLALLLGHSVSQATKLLSLSLIPTCKMVLDSLSDYLNASKDALKRASDIHGSTQFSLVLLAIIS